MRLRHLLSLLVCVLLGAAPPASGTETHSKHDTVVSSPADGAAIAISVYKPAGASAADPVPVILHSHGWSGSRTSAPGAFRAELEAGFGVVSIDQRGHGESGGRAHVQNPDLEGRDIIGVIDHVAGLEWVAKDDPGGNDPVLFAMGGSYGGGYQLVSALTEVRDTGTTRYNALAPAITWFNLAQSLAPQRVSRSAWNTVLYGAGAARVRMADHIHTAFAWGSTTGQWPDETAPEPVPNLQEEFFRNGPSGFVSNGHRLDIPVLFRQGLSDNLFILNQAWRNFELTLTDDARAQSLLVGYNGGHALPNVLPPGDGGSGDPCSAQHAGGFSELRLAFFKSVLENRNPRELVGAPYALATVDGKCLELDSLDRYERYTPRLGEVLVAQTATTTGAGAPQYLELAEGPLTVAGVPQLRADVTSVGVDQRVFLGLAVGTSPGDARVVQNNLLPLRERLPVHAEQRKVELPGLAVRLDEGERLYLVVTPVSDLSFGHGSVRSPGSMLLQNIEVNVPQLQARD